ncbi:MAG: ComF family protein [Clostridia bacterium]|nr:ComF family protein [Clostridia bacterium]
MKKEVKEFFNKLLEVVYPSDITCFLCGNELKDENMLCEDCQKKVECTEKICLKCGSPCLTLADYCLHCQKHKRAFKMARAPFVYSGNIAVSVQNFKYNGKKYLANPFSKMMKKEYEKMEKEGMQVDLIVPVPLHKDRQKKRGFNQAELIAVELSNLINIPISHNNLQRIKNTETQTNLSYKERQKNLDNAFVITDKTEFKDKNILLIDDVLTTGSTADHCATILKKAKAKNVYVLTFATTDGEKNS